MVTPDEKARTADHPLAGFDTGTAIGKRYVDEADSERAVELFPLLDPSGLLGAAYLLGFQHTAVEIDLGVMLVSIVLMLLTPPLCRRYGAPAAIVGLTLSALLFAVGGTWATPNLSPLTALLTLVPLLVGFPYLGRRWIQALSVVARPIMSSR